MRRVLQSARGSVLSVAVAVAGVLGVVPVAPAPPARAEACYGEMTSALRTAKGLLFTGTYLGKQRDQELRRPVRVFDVDRVFAGGDRVFPYDVPTVLAEDQLAAFGAGGCAPMQQLRPGHRYLMSVSWMGPLTAWYGVAWELLPGGRVRLVREYDGAGMDPRLAGPTTVREVVALMRPTYRPPYRGIPLDQLTGTCPTSPATAPSVAPTPSPGASPAVSPGTDEVTPTWAIALQASGPVPLDSACSFDAVTAWSGGFVAVAHQGSRTDRRLVASWSSADAVTWTRTDPQDGAQDGPTVGYGEGLLRFGDDGGTLAVWSSADGMTWTREPATQAFRTPARWLDLDAAVSGARIVVRGTTRDRCALMGCRERTWTWSSGDGVTWIRTDPDDRLQPRPVHPIVGVADGFIALGGHRRILASADGATWRVAGALPPDLLLTGAFFAIPGDPRTYWVTKRNTDATFESVIDSVQASDDLRAWTEIVRSPHTYDWPPVIATGPAGVVLTGVGEKVASWTLSSTDGRTWWPVDAAPGVVLGAPAAAAVGTDATVVVSGGQNVGGALIWSAPVPSERSR